jgi:hypothetical protein
MSYNYKNKSDSFIGEHEKGLSSYKKKNASLGKSSASYTRGAPIAPGRAPSAIGRALPAEPQSNVVNSVQQCWVVVFARQKIILSGGGKGPK